MEGDLAELHGILNRLVPTVQKGVQKLCEDTTKPVETKPASLDLLKFRDLKQLSTGIVLSAYQFWEDPILIIKVRFDDDEFRTIPDEVKDIESLSELDFFRQGTEYRDISMYKLGVDVWDHYEKNYLQTGLEKYKRRAFGIRQSQSFEIELYWNPEFEEVCCNKSLIWAEQFAGIDATPENISESLMAVSQVENGFGASSFDASAFIAANFEDLTKLEEIQEKAMQKRRNMTEQQFGNFGKKKGQAAVEVDASFGASFYAKKFDGDDINLAIEREVYDSITCEMGPLQSEVRAFVNEGQLEESTVLEEETYPNYQDDHEDEFNKAKSLLIVQTEDPEELKHLEGMDFKEYPEDIQLGKPLGPLADGKIRLRFVINPEYGGQTPLENLI